jgi:hypothetical protein
VEDIENLLLLIAIGVVLWLIVKLARSKPAGPPPGGRGPSGVSSPGATTATRAGVQAPTRLERADAIFQAYASLLEAKDNAAMLRPESALPAPKEEVKEALLVVGQHWATRGKQSPEMLAVL